MPVIPRWLFRPPTRPASATLAIATPHADIRPLTTPLVATALAVTLPLLMLLVAINFQFPRLLHAAKVLTDFDSYYVAGQMYWQGALKDAYHFQTLYRAQHRLTGTTGFMPWTYPPPFDLVTAALACLPIAVAYLVFTGTTLLAYVFVLRRIAGVHAATILLAILPAVVLNVRSGQNGFLTGALIGSFLLFYATGRPGGGTFLGFMVFKPHLAIGAAVLALVDRQWRAIAAAVATAAALLALSAAVFGADIFPAFLVGVNEAGHFLAAGYYQLFRMTSVYATLFTAGATPRFALASQAAVALLAVVSIVIAATRCGDRRRVAAFTAFASLFMSPYCYDYDLTILGIAGALLWPSLLVRARRPELFGLIALCWVASGWGLVMSLVQESLSDETSVSLRPMLIPSISSVMLLTVFITVLRMLRRPAFG